MISTIEKFSQSFCVPREEAPSPKTIADIEKAIGFTLPEEQKTLLRECGPVDCPRLLDVVVKGWGSLPVIQTVLSPDEIPSALRKIKDDGFDQNFIPFATDPAGHFLCLKLGIETVFILDTDLGHPLAVAVSLEQLLNSYLELI